MPGNCATYPILRIPARSGKGCKLLRSWSVCWDRTTTGCDGRIRERRGKIGRKREKNVGCFRLSEGFSQAIRDGSPRLILLLFGGIPNSPWILKIVRI